MEVNIAHMDGDKHGPLAVPIPRPMLTAFMDLSAGHSGNHRLSQLLQSMAHQLGDQLRSELNQSLGHG